MIWIRPSGSSASRLPSTSTFVVREALVVLGDVRVRAVEELAGRLEPVLLERLPDLELHGAIALATRLPAGEADAHNDSVDLLHDALDDLRRNVGLVLLEDLRERAHSLVRQQRLGRGTV